MKVVKFDFCRNEDLTIEELKECPLFTSFSDQEALIILETIKTFTRIIFDYYSRKSGQIPLKRTKNDVSSI